MSTSQAEANAAVLRAYPVLPGTSTAQENVTKLRQLHPRRLVEGARRIIHEPTIGMPWLMTIRPRLIHDYTLSMS